MISTGTFGIIFRNADVNFMGNRSDFTSVYEHNLKKALSINRSSCGGKRYQSKIG